MTISGKKNCKENILYLHWYQMKHDGCVICRKPEKRCITLRAQVISLPNWQQEETSHWKIPICSTIQVHLANDDPISALDDAVAVLKIQSDDFTALCIKVTIWRGRKSFQQILFAGSLFLLSRSIWEEPPGRSSWQIKISTWDSNRSGPRQTGWGAITRRFYWSFFFTSI